MNTARLSLDHLAFLHLALASHYLELDFRPLFSLRRIWYRFVKRLVIYSKFRQNRLFFNMRARCLIGVSLLFRIFLVVV